MHYLYVLYSQKLNRYYVGETADVDFRIQLHLNKVFSNSFTSKASDWNLELSYQTQTKEQAVFLERFIKRMKSKKFIEKTIQNPSILDDILNQNT